VTKTTEFFGHRKLESNI